METIGLYVTTLIIWPDFCCPGIAAENGLMKLGYLM